MKLTRDQFRQVVFERDNSCCVICGDSLSTVVAHHIIERRLWGKTEGYFINNGATLCPIHHILAEQTILSCEEIRTAAGITETIIPDHFYKDTIINKWGDIILPDGSRLKGELFFDPSVQRILKEGDVLDLYCKYVKYPRTFHLPFSPGLSKDDRILESVEPFINKEIIITEKRDGENSTLYNNYLHARSVCSNSHPSQSWLKNFHAKIAYLIPEGWRICGENLYAKHTIEYNCLNSYFEAFSIWNDRNECLSWQDTLEWAELLEVIVVPILYQGLWNEDKIKELCKNENIEGFVVRLSSSFTYGDFRRSVAKYVNKKFKKDIDEKGDNHWRYKNFTINKLYGK